jgi:hypothetical protein
MTLPDERYRSIQHAALFLQQLCNPAITKRIPREIRREAARVLRHFPSQYDLQQLESAAPHVVQQRMEPLHRMVTAYTAMTPEHDDNHEGSTLD